MRSKQRVSYVYYMLRDTCELTSLDPTSRLSIGRLNEIAYLIGSEFVFQHPAAHKIRNNAGLDICEFNTRLSMYVIKEEIPCIVRLENSKTHAGFHHMYYLDVDRIPIGDELTQVLHI